MAESVIAHNAKHFLVATHNQDKSQLAAALLMRADPSFRVVLLDQVGVSEELTESGSLLDRSVQKAITYGALGRSRAPGRFDYVLGIDDAIIFEGQLFDPTDSKRATETLLAGGLRSGSKVILRQAMTVIEHPNYLSSFVVEVPFIYVTPSERIENQPGSYPLLQVLRIPHRDASMGRAAHSEVVEYYWEHCGAKFVRALKDCGAMHS